MTSVFVPAVGQYDNIGDVILRRPHLAMLRPHGTLHVYLGHHPEGYAAGLDLDASDVVYRSFRQWYTALLEHARTETVHYAFKPGEIQLSVPGLKEHVVMVPALRAVHNSGGRVVRIGAGARALARVPRAMMRPSLALTDLSVWRDADTAAFLGGETMPDLGFATGPERPPLAERDLLVLSLRGDRPTPPPVWLSGMRRLAAHLGVAPMVVTQVARDSGRSAELARALDAELLDFDGHDHAGQEAALRAAYGRAAAVSSDRLHVLIAAATEDAPVLAPLPHGGMKIRRHFEAAGFPQIDWDVRTQTPTDLVDEALRRREAQQSDPQRLARARAAITGTRAHVDALLRGTRT